MPFPSVAFGVGSIRTATPSGVPCPFPLIPLARFAWRRASQDSSDSPSLCKLADGVGSSPGEYEDPLPFVRCAGFGRGYSDPLRVIPEVGQRPENGSDCPNKSLLMPLASSHCPLSQSHDASGSRRTLPDTAYVPSFERDVVLVVQPDQQLPGCVPGGFSGQVLLGGLVAAGGEQAADVLDDDKGRPQDVDGFDDLEPQPGPGSVPQARTLPRSRDVLARETCRQHVHRLDRSPVRDRDIAKVRDTGEPVRQDRGRAGVVVRHPGELAAEHLMDGQAQALVAAADRADAELVHAHRPQSG